MVVIVINISSSFLDQSDAAELFIKSSPVYFHTSLSFSWTISTHHPSKKSSPSSTSPSLVSHILWTHHVHISRCQTTLSLVRMVLANMLTKVSYGAVEMICVDSEPYLNRRSNIIFVLLHDLMSNNSLTLHRLR